MDFLCCRGSLKLLAVEELGFDLGEWFTGFNEFLGAFTVSTTITCRDQVGNTSGFVGEATHVSSLVLSHWPITYVSAFEPLKNSKQNSRISIKPIRRIAALVFPPIPSPSTKPAARATMFFKAPLSETPMTSSTTETLNVGASKTAFHN